MSGKELGNTLYGLVTQMGLAYHALPRPLLASIYRAIESADTGNRTMGITFDKQALTAVLQSLASRTDRESEGARSPSSWRDLPAGVQSAILHSSRQLLEAEEAEEGETRTVFDVKLLSDILQSLGRLRVRWLSDLPSAFRALIFRLLSEAADFEIEVEASATSAAVSSAINGIARMVLNERGTAQEAEAGPVEGWCSLSLSEQATLSRLLIKYTSSMSSNDIASIFWALSSLEVHHPNLPENLRATVMKGFNDTLSGMQLSEFVWTLHSSSKIGLRFADFSSPTQDTIISLVDDFVKKMKGNDFRYYGLLLWVLTSLQAPMNELPESIRASFLSAVGSVLNQRQRIKWSNKKRK